MFVAFVTSMTECKYSTYCIMCSCVLLFLWADHSSECLIPSKSKLFIGTKIIIESSHHFFQRYDPNCEKVSYLAVLRTPSKIQLLLCSGLIIFSHCQLLI